MMNPMAIYLIRHGETPLNAKRVIQFPDTPLSDRGQAQARALGERLSTAPVGAVVTSDYQRAYMTADAVRKTTDAPMEIETTLRERNFGDLRGQAFADLDEDPFAPGMRHQTAKRGRSSTNVQPVRGTRSRRLPRVWKGMWSP